MSKIKNLKTTKLIKNTLIGSFILLIGCSNPVSSEYEANLSFDMRLPKDSNGYYHMTLGDNWQTLHRVSGSIRKGSFGVENFWVEWESNLYWYLGDTLGYFIRRVINAEGHYVSLDTSYAIGFDGMEVPTINPASYSNGSGEFNQMFAPVRSMVGDTLVLTATWYNSDRSYRIVLD